MFKFLVLIALLGVVAGDPSVALRKAMRDWADNGLFKLMEPEKTFQMVGELKKHYENMPFSHTMSIHDEWMKTTMPILYGLGNISRENCNSLDEYNKESKDLAKSLSNLQSAVAYLNYFREKQNELCKSQ